jgi:hypothetical protein
MFEMTVRIGSPSEIFSNHAIIPSDIWSVGKEPIAMFEFTMLHASFPNFFIILRCYTVIWKQLSISNDRNRVRYEVSGHSQDGACTDLFENPSVNSLKGDLCHHIQPISFLIGQYFNVNTNPGLEGEDGKTDHDGGSEEKGLIHQNIVLQCCLKWAQNIFFNIHSKILYNGKCFK